MKLYAIVGAGGCGRGVIPLVRPMLTAKAAVDYEIIFVDDNPVYKNKLVNSYTVLSFAEFYAHSATEKFFSIAIADSKIRERLANALLDKGFNSFRIVANNFIELDNNEIDQGAIFCPFTMITSNVKIGKFFHANIYSYVEHDCVIGDYVTFAPNVHCNGNIIIEDHVYVGTGVIIKQGTATSPLIIGKGAVLGMGAVVTKSVAPFTTVIGNPARPFVASVEKTMKI